jgi:hypothetical protein
MGKTRNDGPVEASSRWKEIREWLTVVFGLGATLLGIVTYNQGKMNDELSRRNSELEAQITDRDRKAELEETLSHAWDRMGGEGRHYCNSKNF